jgi:phytanoyl-CoA hydroxylase
LEKADSAAMLSFDQKQFWAQKGYLVLPGYFDPGTMDRISDLHRRLWEERPAHVVVDDLDTNERLPITDVPEEKIGGRFKLNDLYLDNEEVRQVSLDPGLVEIIQELLNDAPVLCNTLDLDYGTQQDFHADSLFMTPPSPNNLLASWVALEDVSPDAGPLEYYPGSHLIPVYRFSTGSDHCVHEEMPFWKRHIQESIEAYGLKKESFLPKKGDVFLWHAYLLHAGGKVKDRSLTRRSLVSHYYVASDFRHSPIRLLPCNNGFWMDRKHISLGEQDDSRQLSMLKFMVGSAIHHLRTWREEVANHRSARRRDDDME